MVNFLWDNLFRKDQREKSLIDIIADNFLFDSLSKSELRFVKELVHVRNYKAGEAVFRQGEVGIGMYLVAEGGVDILIEDPLSDRPEMQTVFITRLGPSDFFGELSLVEDHGRRTAAAVASVDSTLIGFFKPDLMEIVERNPETGAKILLRLAEVLGRRLKDTTAKVSELKREIRNERETSGQS